MAAIVRRRRAVACLRSDGCGGQCCIGSQASPAVHVCDMRGPAGGLQNAPSFHPQAKGRDTMQHAYRRAGAALVAAALLATSSLAMAQPHRPPPGHDRRPPHAAPPHPMPPQARPGHRPHKPPPHARGAHFHGQRGAGPQHNWYRGGRIPPAYRGGHYVVNDWRMHRLAPPPGATTGCSTGPTTCSWPSPPA